MAKIYEEELSEDEEILAEELGLGDFIEHKEESEI